MKKQGFQYSNTSCPCPSTIVLAHHFQHFRSDVEEDSFLSLQYWYPELRTLFDVNTLELLHLDDLLIFEL